MQTSGPKMKHFAKALDLKNDPKLIAEYEAYHQVVWKDVLAAIRHVGILDMKIYRLENHMFMYMTTEDDYDIHAAAQYFKQDPSSIKWEALMDRFQQRLACANEGEKWVEMQCCFDLNQTKINS
jgi:L-rhamnose mutarotase